MARLTGRALRGERLRGSLPNGHRWTTTLVVGLRFYGIEAPMPSDGPISGEIFQTDIDRLLVPALRPSDVVIMDILGSHKGAGVRVTTDLAGGQHRFLPPFSPYVTPIENVFAKLKALLRKASARNRDTLGDIVAAAIERYHLSACASSFAAAAYELE